jgi:hypothetical protein
VRHRRGRRLDDRVGQDHRRIGRRTRPMPGFGRFRGARPTHPGRRRGDCDAGRGAGASRARRRRAGAAGLRPPGRCSASRPDRKGATRGTPRPRSRSASSVTARRACSRCRAVARPSCPQIRVGSRSVVGGVGERGSRRGRDRQVTDGQGGEKAEVATRADRVWRRQCSHCLACSSSPPHPGGILTTTTPRGEEVLLFLFLTTQGEEVRYSQCWSVKTLFNITLRIPQLLFCIAQEARYYARRPLAGCWSRPGRGSGGLGRGGQHSRGPASPRKPMMPKVMIKQIQQVTAIRSSRQHSF